MANSLSSLLTQTTGSSPLHPVVTIALSPTNNTITPANTTSTTLLKLPVSGGTTPTYTGSSPSAGGSTPSLAGGTGGTASAPSLGGNGVNSISSGAIPTNTPPVGQQVAATPYTYLTFSVASIFPTAASATGATAVTFSATGSPAWAGVTVPVNGYFTINSTLISNGDIVQVKVTPGSPGSAADAAVSNPIPFSILSNAVTVISNTAGSTVRSDAITVPVVDGANIYFSGNTFNGAAKLYKLDTASGDTITQITDLGGSLSTDQPIPLAGFNGFFYFAANNSSAAQKLFKTDSSGTLTQITNLRGSQSFPDNPINIGVPPTIGATPGIVVNNKFYFSALNSNGFTKLYCVDTSDTVTQVSNTRNNQSQDDTPTNGIVFNNALYLSMRNSATGASKLYKVDSSNTVTQVGNTSASNDQCTPLGVANSILYMRANNSNGVAKLFAVSTSDVVTQVSNLTGSQTIGDQIQAVGTSYNGFFYFIGTTGSSTLVNTKLLKINASGTITQVSNTTGTVGSDGPIASTLTTLSGGVYCAMNDTKGVNRLFRVDASDVLTQVAAPRPFGPDAISLPPIEPVAGQGVYVVATEGGGITKLFKVVDGSYCYQVSDFVPTLADAVTLPLSVNGAAYFVTGMNTTGTTKWVKYS